MKNEQKEMSLHYYKVKKNEDMTKLTRYHRVLWASLELFKDQNQGVLLVSQHKGWDGYFYDTTLVK